MLLIFKYLLYNETDIVRMENVEERKVWLPRLSLKKRITIR